jgi:hypothetical protein
MLQRIVLTLAIFGGVELLAVLIVAAVIAFTAAL